MQVAFRVDAATHIGSGHAMRCLTLADFLRARGHRARFLMRDPHPATAELIRTHGHEVQPLRGPGEGVVDQGRPLAHGGWLGVSQADDAAECARLLAPQRPDWLVVDHYALDRRWEQSIRRHVGRILVVDDLADRAHDCDVLLDQNYYRDHATRYASLVPERCRTLLGPQAAILRDEFVDARPRCRPRRGEVGRVLVFITTFDPTDATGLAVDAIAGLRAPQIGFDIVVGAGNRQRDRLADRVAGLGNCTFHAPAASMAALMAHADLSIGAGGSATLERCFLGLPTLAMHVAANQETMLRDLDEAGGVVHVGAAERLDAGLLARSLDRLIADEPRRASVSRKGFELVSDGKPRLAALMEAHGDD